MATNKAAGADAKAAAPAAKAQHAAPSATSVPAGVDAKDYVRQLTRDSTGMAPVLIFANPNGDDTLLAVAAESVGKVAKSSADFKPTTLNAAGDVNTAANAAGSGVDEKDVTALTAAYEAGLRGVTQLFQKQHPKATAEQILACCRTAFDRVLTEVFTAELAKASALPAAGSGAAAKKKTRAYIDGCFDIMHSGHYNAIRQAKALCDTLVVGVHSDSEILRHKGPPVMNEEERLSTVRACKWVDEVVFDTPYDPSLKLLDEVRCDFCIHGDDTSTTADGKDAYEETKKAGRMKVIKRTEGVSTTDLVGRLLLMTKSHHLSPVTSPSLSPVQSPVITSAAAGKAGAASAMPLLALGASAAPAAGSGAAAGAPAAAPAKPAAAKGAAGAASASASGDGTKHYSAGISSFLPTTWRISQFSNNKAPGPTDKVVYVDGAFDLFHIGHIETLQKAKALGTFLYVGIHDDATVNAHKGRNYPIMNLHERVMNVLSCKFVDEVVIGAPWHVTRDLITSLNIKVVARGSNAGKLDPAAAAAGAEPDPYEQAKKLVEVVDISSSRNLMTEDVVERIISNRLKYEKRNQKRSAKELAYIDKRTFVQEI